MSWSQRTGLAASANAVCTRRHPAEWDAPRPRMRACDECRLVSAVAVESYFLAAGDPPRTDAEVLQFLDLLHKRPAPRVGAVP